MDKMKDIKSIKTEKIVDQLLRDYEKQKSLLPFLPPGDDFREMLTNNVAVLQKTGTGWAFTENNQLKGLFAGYKIDALFGKAKGIYIPLYGHCIFAEDEREIRKIDQKMYTYASAQWVKAGYLSHTITVYAKNQIEVDTLFWLGFGNRCVDAIKSCETDETGNEKIRIKKAQFNDLQSIAPLEEKNHTYFRTAPLFMPADDTPPLESLKEWFSRENRHLWIALEGEKPVGFMRIQNEGESFITYHNRIMNITGAYIIPEKRGSGIATMLLNEIQQWLLTNNTPLLGVDFESFNVKGASFWIRHFIPYTFSLSRRIDERITPYAHQLRES